MEIIKYSNYINFNPDGFDVRKERVFFLENFDDKYVSGFKWSYLHNYKIPVRISMARFLAEYKPKPELDFGE